MEVAELRGVALDYWLARALEGVIEEIHFSEDKQVVGVTSHQRAQLADGEFSPSTSWAALGPVLEQTEHLAFTVSDAFTPEADRGTVRCVARFTATSSDTEAHGNTKRLALSRCFITARLGPTVDDDYPHTPQRLQEGRVLPGHAIDALPRIQETPDPNGAIGDIKSLPRY